MEWIIKEILLAAILGMFIIISFAKLHTWLNIKINIYNNKKLTNNLTNHEKSTPIKTSEADYSV